MSYEYITRFNSPNYTTKQRTAQVFGVARSISGIVIHHWGDPATRPSFSGVISWLCRRGGNSSAHMVIEAGRCACIVPLEGSAWHSGSARGNATTIGLELNPRASEADYATASEVIADLWLYYGVLPLTKHSYWKATACPGRWDIDRLKEMAMKDYRKKKGNKHNGNSVNSTAKYHTVKMGETLTSISRKYNTSVSELMKINKISDKNKINVNQKIKIKK